MQPKFLWGHDPAFFLVFVGKWRWGFKKRTNQCDWADLRSSHSQKAHMLDRYWQNSHAKLSDIFFYCKCRWVFFLFVCLFFTQISIGATFWIHDNCKISLISLLWKDFKKGRMENVHLCLEFPLIACDKRWLFPETEVEICRQYRGLL